MSRAPPGSRPPAYAIVSRIYGSSLRPVVVISEGIGAFEEVNVDKDHGFPKFATIAIALGALYMTVLAIELFGVTAAVMNNLLLIRIYSILSALSALIVIAAAFLRVIIHFVFKKDLINECTQLATGQDVVTRFGIWGPTIHDELSPDEAQDFCNHWWSRDSFGEIISLIVLIILSAFFVSIAFAFYHQVNDPTFQRTREAPTRTDGFPEHYSPPYVGYSYNGPPPQARPPRYDPPTGPPPSFSASQTQGMGYGVGAPKVGSAEDLKGDDPFADFDEPVNRGKPGESRDNLV
ncbi:hypothetical protein BDY19DRAFT_949549 [Irpex rosettiformis]|uniref:Uncharacterized protein n=1 Tax=Irpex rosettiformis TaxID=378272 RepID=A0ACB8U1U9_9APHY|nr:hypothetical protein BDY19DRAFT_949549 [Irpex rosettiformis]